MTRVRHRVGWIGVAFALLSVTMAVLWVSGWVMYLLPADDLMELSEMQAALRRSAGVIHGVTAWGVCVLCGRGVWPHVQLMLHRRVNRRQWSWGIVNGAVMGGLLLSGLVLLYGSSTWHAWMSPSHFWLGALAPLPYVIHGWKRLFPRRASTLGA